ncbi:MAG: zf-HC2 domain-containing protein [Verrucomicrobiota bacterium]
MKFFTWMNHCWPTCKEMSRLASESLDHPLGSRVRLKMLLHSSVCVWCRRYSKQLRFIRQAAPKYEEKIGQVSTRTLSPEAKTRMKAELQKNG